MATLTEILAAVAVHSSTAALSHFGVTLAPAQVVPAAPVAQERVVARTPKISDRPAEKRLADCPKTRPHTVTLHA